MESGKTDKISYKKRKLSTYSIFFWVNRALAVALLLAVVSCGGDGSSTTGPDPDPDPDPDPNRNVSYSQDIQPIFNGNCALSGCHNSSTQESGVNLTSYDNALGSVGVQYGTEIIEPGEPENSPIVDKISNDNPENGERMPFEQGPLSQANIDSIVAWIDDGAPDN